MADDSASQYSTLTEEAKTFELRAMRIFNTIAMTGDGSHDAPTRFPEMILNGRFAVVRRLSARSFAGFTVKGSTSFLEGSNGDVRYGASAEKQ